MTDLSLRVGAALYFWRTFNGQSQHDVSQVMKNRHPWYNRLENSRSTPTLATFLMLAEALDVSPYILALTMEAF